ncbi:MMPL family transporter [Streptomyces sp. WMMC500]|uniref:MMPL family transporter n=1 Tax=Streptomyces sp. WMMC500 TaxID=3015154 RepID=UPI00248B2EC5|nr:MMPL family transporter [Streptomyces sp. WMMC500]WBB64666.1 MMPL family transporter [Streptomyces sp. WMMC500]
MVGLWVAILALALPFGGKLGDASRDRPVDYLPGSADSTQVSQLAEEMPGGDTLDGILVYQRDGGVTAADRTLAAEHAGDLAGRYELARDRTPQAVPSEDGTTLMVPFSVVGLPDEDAQMEAVEEIREQVIADPPEGLSVELGGPAGIQADSEAVYEQVDGTLMYTTAGIVTILLILTYRSPFLWLLPLVCVGVASLSAMALVYGLIQAFDLTVNSMSSAVMTVLIFGAGTDYALLLVARYREELRRTARPQDAMLTALRNCGPAILASSGTVAAGLICLLAADLNSSAGLGPVGAVGVVCALAVMTTLLPALMVLFGRRIFWPLIPAYGSEPKRRGFFDRMGSSVGRRPAAILVGGVVLLGALALGAFNLPGNLKQEDAFTDKPESITAMEKVKDAFPDQGAQAIVVVAKEARADAALSTAQGVEGVASAEITRSGNGFSEITVYASDPPQSAEEDRTIAGLRAELGALDGADALVGGPSAEALDLAEANAGDRKLVIPLTLAAVLVILIALLRSLVAPLVLTVAVVASWGAAMGIGGLVFEPVMGYPGISGDLALLTFVFGVALGVDYGIFLLHRMREEAAAGTDTRTAALTALRRTGGVIASAGVVLAATFAVLMTMPMVMIFELGFIVAVGVLLDTFLVRTYLVTSASWLLGRKIWWPGPLSKRPENPPPAAGERREPEPEPAGATAAH